MLTMVKANCRTCLAAFPKETEPKLNQVKTSLVVASFVVACSARAFTFTLTPVTYTTPNDPNPIFINGTVTVAANETYGGWSQFDACFLPGFTAGFNGPPQNFTAAFLAWNGIGTFTGAIYEHHVNATNFGYSGGMPVGLYDRNPLGPGGFSSIKLRYADGNGVSHDAAALYGIQVDAVPEPASMTISAAVFFALLRRRSRAS